MSCICLAAFLMRMICCFWGSPLQLHPDEQVPVDYAMELLARHSYEVSTYNRPDHFEIKCDAVIFTAYSLLRYHAMPYRIVNEHRMEFYVLARMYTALFGTALIPLSALFTGFLLKEQKKSLIRSAQLAVSAFVAFSAIFVQHSAYATPDIVLTFFVILFAYFQAKYLENGAKKDLILCAVITGIGITIKYPAALLCIAIAASVIIRALVIEKKPLLIIRYGFLSAALVLLSVFVLAPNLITNPEEVYVHLVEESGGSNLGASGLGFTGNFLFYGRTMLEDAGLIVLFFVIAGLLFLLKHRNRKQIAMVSGLLWWVCMSALSLHWVRWGIPIYPFYYILAATGIAACLDACRTYRKQDKPAALRIASYLPAAAVCLIMFNIALCGLCMTKYSATPEIRYTAQTELKKAGITPDNTVYDSYTPFAPTDGENILRLLHIDPESRKPVVEADTASKDYLMLSGITRKKVMADPERYESQRLVYEWLDDNAKVAFRKKGSGTYETGMSVLANSLSSIRFLCTKSNAAGCDVTVYRLPLPD